MLSDIHGAVDGLGSDHAITPGMAQQWESSRLSQAEASPEAVAATLVYWAGSWAPARMMRFADMAQSEVPQVGCDAIC